MATSLPSLRDVERLSPRVIRILGGNPNKFTLQGTNTYLVGTGPTRILIDTAQGLASWKSHLSALLSTESCAVSKVLLTHWHPDHIDGVPDLLTLCPSAQLYKFQAGPSVTPNLPEGKQIEPISDSQIFQTEGATLRAVHSPGHTADHVAFVLAEEEGALFSGDAVLGHGTAVFEDLAEYMKCLETLERNCGEGARLYPAHGDVVALGREKIAEYAAHRRQREGEVLKALREGGKMTSMEVVQVVYAKYPESLHEPAEKGVKQILAKLRDAGMVLEGEGRWGVIGKATL